MVVILISMLVLFRKLTFKIDECALVLFIIGGFCALLLTGIIIIWWMFDKQTKKLIENEILREEKENIRKHEESQSDRNHTYRLEALKWEKVHQIFHDFSEKKEVIVITKGKTEKTITLTFNSEIIEEIKKLKSKIDGIN